MAAMRPPIVAGPIARALSAANAFSPSGPSGLGALAARQGTSNAGTRKATARIGEPPAVRGRRENRHPTRAPVRLGAAMTGYVSFHPIDLAFFDELIAPLVAGRKVNPEAFLQRAAAQ